MQITSDPHLDEEALERFALGQVPEDLAASIEEHLLACPGCLARLEDAEQYILVTKSAITQYATVPVRGPSLLERASRLWSAPKPVWGAVALAALIVAVGIPVSLYRSGAPAVLSEITLQAARGAGTTVIAQSRSGLIALNMDVQELSASGPFRMRVVNEDGAVLWSGAETASAGRLHVPIPVKLSSGRYWVRLYDTSGALLLREYGLQLK